MKLLEKAVECRGGSFTLYEGLFPLKTDFYFVIERKNKTVSGLIIPNSVKEDYEALIKKGDKIKVIATGSECKDLKCGDYVLVQESYFGLAASFFKLENGDEFGISKETYVKGIFTGIPGHKGSN